MRVCLSWSIFFAASTPMSPLPARVHQLAEVSVLRDEYTPLAQRALHRLFPGYPRRAQLQRRKDLTLRTHCGK